ncbi:hypothetical protein F5888DRAFT_1060486 [Russula emetica]|nr:hypothetical protein F5888DRAFT_1060486 [Russula emetica]
MIRLRFSNTIPNDTNVPAWAFLDVTRGTWNPVLSYQVGDTPEMPGGESGTFSPLPTPTTTQTSVPGLSSSQSQFASKGNAHHSNETAAVVGGVLGGIVFIVLTIALMLWRQRIKRRRTTRAAAAVILGNRGVPLQEKKRNRDEPPRDIVASAI